MTRLLVPLLLLALTSVGCVAARPAAYERPAELVDPTTVDLLLRTHALADNESVRRDEFLRTDDFSASLLQARGAFGPLVHRRHDLIVLAHAGVGRISVERRLFSAERGDAFIIPRGAAYAFKPQDDATFVGVLIFTPPYAGDDTLRVTDDGGSYPRDAEDALE